MPRRRYDDAIAEQLELAELTTLGAERAARVLIMPAFDVDVALTAWSRADRSGLDVRSLPHAGRRLALERAGLTVRQERVVMPGRPAPSPEQNSSDRHDLDARTRAVELALATDETDGLWRRLDALDREQLRAPPRWGLDGVSVAASVLDPGGSIESFEMWCPRRASAGGELVASLLDLARAHVRDSHLASVLARIPLGL